MRFMRPVIALHPAQFGRGRIFHLGGTQAEGAPLGWLEDAKLFAMTFLGGFLFVAVYLA